MSDQNFSAIRARLRYETIEDFVDGYARFISAGGMFIPMKPGKLKPIGTTIRFQFLLGDGSTALLGEGVVLQVRAPDDASPQSPVGMLIKFSKLAQESKALVDRIVAEKSVHSTATDEAEEADDDIHNDRTPLPEDKESYERKTRESFDIRAANQALAAEASAAADVHSKTTDAGTDRSKWEETTREQRLVPDDEPTSDEEEAGSPVNDSFGSDEEANDALVAAALAVSSEVAEEALESESEDISLEEIDPETAEAPEVAEPETREAPEMIDELVEQVAPKGPTQLGETTGGLKILAFEEDMDAAALQALEEFSFGADEADIDDMFDGLFGDGGGGFFGGESEPEAQSAVEPEAQPSMEFEVSGLTQEVSDELVEEAVAVGVEDSSAEEIVEEPSEEKPVFSLEDLMDDEEPEAQLAPEESEVIAESAPEEVASAEPPSVFSLEDLMDDEESEPVHADLVPSESDDDSSESELAFSLSDIVDDADSADLADEESAPVLSLDDALEDSEPELMLETSEEESFLAEPSSEPKFSHGHEDIGSLLDNLDDDSRMSPDALHLGTSRREEPVAEDEPAVEDGESLEFLLASARREIEERSTEEPRDSGDILDQLLGDDLPPPPGEGPVFGMPQPEKKKKGFLSKFFDKG